jgi:hypothetical protein|tara:strand:- start:468 stop:626 length:159 start_codon:yes stop_codon:yes gene_type:complete
MLDNSRCIGRGSGRVSARALEAIEVITSEQALARKADGDIVFVDIRDVREAE